jgi:hypothetical protein
LKTHIVHSGTCTRFAFSQLTQKHVSLSHKQREEDLGLHQSFRVYNQQTFQALKTKSNPKQGIKNANQVMEEEDLPFQTPFFLQSANKPNPEEVKQPKTSNSKCNCNPSSSITQQKIQIQEKK